MCIFYFGLWTPHHALTLLLTGFNHLQRNPVLLETLWDGTSATCGPKEEPRHTASQRANVHFNSDAQTPTGEMKTYVMPSRDHFLNDKDFYFSHPWVSSGLESFLLKLSLKQFRDFCKKRAFVLLQSPFNSVLSKTPLLPASQASTFGQRTSDTYLYIQGASQNVVLLLLTCSHNWLSSSGS